MKIIFSPSKEMTFNSPCDIKVEYSDKTKIIIEELKKYSPEELKEIYKISGKVLDDVTKYIESFNKKESYKAVDMYSGLAFRKLDVMTLKDDERKYLDKKLKILSAFYGPISTKKLIRPYRLDFNTKIKIEGKSLKKFWEDEFNKSFDEKETILNLASNEFSSLLNRNKFKIYDFEFFEKKGDKLKNHSTISKKARGLMLRFLSQNKLEEVQKVKNFDLDGYKFAEELSEDMKFVFVKE